MGWVLAWADEFDSPVLDASRWDRCFFDGVRTGWPPNPHGQEWQYYTDEDCYIEDGHLRFRARKRDYLVGSTTWHYTSGMVSSALKFFQLFGRFEARIRMPQGVNGFWPAFWLCANPDPHVWPPEIDIMEQFSKADGYYTTHTANDGSDNPIFQGWPMHLVADVSEWHIYAVEWTRDLVVFSMDGVEQCRTTERVNNDLPMYILLNLAVDGGVLNPPHHAPDAETPFPSYMDVDYVRVYREAAAGEYVMRTDVNIGISNWHATGLSPRVPQYTVDLLVNWLDGAGVRRNWSGEATFPNDLDLLPAAWVKDAIQTLLIRAARNRLGVDD